MNKVNDIPRQANVMIFHKLKYDKIEIINPITLIINKIMANFICFDLP